MNYKIIPIKTVNTENEGALSFFEGGKDVPFQIKRIYYIHDVSEGIERGKHAHKTLKQLLFCPYGCIDIILDDGKAVETVTLDTPGKGLCLEPGLWRNMVWKKKDSVLCVAASDFYDEHDYIRDYDEFLDYAAKKYR